MENKDVNLKIQEGDVTQRYLQFDLGPESYAIHLLDVKEVISLTETTPLPNSPSYYVGIMNLRGLIISIIDLRKKMSITKKEEGLEEAIIIIEIDGIGIGVIVDSINKVLNINLSEIVEVPEIGSNTNGKFIQGVYKGEGQLTMMLDLASVLNIPEIKKSQKVAA